MTNFLHNNNQTFPFPARQNFANFAQQPMQGGMMNVLTAFDLYRDDINRTEVFDKADLFLPNESIGESTFKSLDGSVMIIG